jgi:magnesium transporter
MAADLTTLAPEEWPAWLEAQPAEEAQAVLAAVPREQLHETLRHLDNELAARLLALLTPETAAEALSELPYEDAAEALASHGLERAVAVIQELSPDDAADIIAEMPAGQRAALLDASGDAGAVIEELLVYPEDTAGGRMTPEVLSIRRQWTVAEAIDAIRRRSEELEQIYYTYVVDRNDVLIGVVTMRDLILAPPGAPIEAITNRDVTVVSVDTDQETVAEIISDLNLLALPVVDRQGRLVGIVTVDDVIDVIQEEASEDLQRLVGAGADERTDSPFVYSVRMRLPWLHVNLLTAFLAAAVVGMFQGSIARLTILAVFLPVVAGQGGNAGAQTMAVVIRGLALGEIPAGYGRRVVARELLLGLVNGIVVGVVTAVIAWATSNTPAFGLVLGLAMVINMALACACGAVIPLGLRAVGLDPAQASSIFLTTVTDVVGFGAFLGLAAIALKIGLIQ